MLNFGSLRSNLAVRMMKVVVSTLLSVCAGLAAGAAAPPPHEEVARWVDIYNRQLGLTLS